MKLVYVSGPITGDGAVWTRFMNNIEGLKVGREIDALAPGKLGAIIPHGNTFMFDGHDMTWEQWLEIDLEILRRVDGIVMMPGWEASKGARMELGFATSLGLEAFYWPQAKGLLAAWAEGDFRVVESGCGGCSPGHCLGHEDCIDPTAHITEGPVS